MTQQTRGHGGHSHSHHHHHDNNDAGVRITRIGLYSNLGMAIAKGVGGYVFNSQSMIADAWHSLTDLASDILTLATVSWSLKPPTERFPMGFGKVESLGSLGVSSMLLFGGLFMCMSSCQSLYAHFFLDPAAAAELLEHAHLHGHSHSHAFEGPSLHAAWLAAGTVAIKEWLYHATMKVARERKSSVLASNAVHHRVDSLTGIVTLAAILGANFLQDATWLDPVGGLLISLLVIRAGWGNTLSALFELADKSIDDEVKKSVRKQVVKGLMGVTESQEIELRDVSGIKSGQNYLIDLELAVPNMWTVEDCRGVEDAVRTQVGAKVRGVRRVRVRFVPKELAATEKPFDEFIPGDSDLTVLSDAKVDFDADFGSKYGITKGVLTNPAEGEVFAPVAMWLEALDLVLDRLQAKNTPLSRIRGISGSCQQHGSVYWSHEAEALLSTLRPERSLVDQLNPGAFSHPYAPNWQDHSTQAECDLFESRIGSPEKLAEVTGSSAHHRFTGTQIMRLRRKLPDMYAATSRISLVSSFLASLFLGSVAPMDISDACGMNLWDIPSNSWSAPLLDLVAGGGGGDDVAIELKRKLGDVRQDGGGSMGSISTYFQSRYGFSKECQIAPFTGDNPATILALPLRPGDAIVSLGTSTTFLMITPIYKPDPSYHYFNHPTTPGQYMFMLCYKNGGLAREKVRDVLPKADGGGGGGDAWETFNKCVMNTPPLDVEDPGRDKAKLGLYFYLPEIVPNIKAGTWRYACNASDGSGLEEVEEGWAVEKDARLIVESQALSMRLRSQKLVEKHDSDLPAQPRRVYLVGGGSLNPAIARVMGDVLGGVDGVYKLDVGGNACALGGAYKAVWALERGAGETFDELIGKRWKEEGAIQKVDDGYRQGMFEQYGTSVCCNAVQSHSTQNTVVYAVIQLPLGFIYERAFLRKKHQSPFVQRASLFEDFVIRCVRYAFANIKPNIGRVFLSKEVALRFLSWRMFRHGYLHPPIYWHEYHDAEDSFRGIWLVKNPMYKPDLVIYYAHGGGFSMGSSYFYLEFLMSWMSLLMSSGYLNPAIFALEYTLVPDASFPTQVHETIKGYAHVISVIGDSAGVVVSGDSAGATLMLILLLRIADGSAEANKGLKNRHCRLGNPGMAVLISPWTTLTSWRHKNTSSDYLNVKELHRYGLQFAGNNISKNDPLVSPGNCKDLDWWSRASPSRGFFVAYGKEEVLAPEIENLVQVLQKAGVVVESKGEPGGIHAWPVASLFLSSTHDERLKGLRAITENISQRVGSLGLR
ncbi:putative xylulose kinase [Diplogelasinospora grovesii]|uniref:xylulokinase n=1 Tax=Diplogelasinospora grovesii TaxID=303347 RepID=A0AAN6NAW1_9PEZI|nr:putative xylulose kinase [Diplogelasinospora grovesii]